MPGIDYTNLDPDVVTLAKAIRQVESGGDFNAVGDNGDSHGAYQFNKGNFAHWATQFNLDPNDFSPVNQDKVAYAKMKTWKDQGYHANEIAAMWNGSHLDKNKRPVANHPDYITKVDKAVGQTKLQGNYNPNPFSSGQVNLQPESKTDIPGQTQEGIFSAFSNFGAGLLKGTGQVFNAPAKGIANKISSLLKVPQANIEKANKQIDETYKPKGTAQKVGAFVGRDVLPATAALTTAGAGLTAGGANLPAVAKSVAGHIGRNWIRYGLLAELARGKDPVQIVKGVLKELIQ
jgi:hypothetical protein